MKKKKLLRSFDLAHEQYVDEADPARDAAVRKNAFSKNKIVKWSALVASLLAVVIVANVFLFMPYDNTPPSVDEYANSEYYPIIKKLNQLTYNTYKKPKYKNLFEYIKDSLENIDFDLRLDQATGEAVNDAAPMKPGEMGNASGVKNENEIYEETTDNQVAGVTEADRIKRSDKYIYYLCDEVLFVYSIKGEGSELVGKYVFSEFVKNGYLNEWEFYLSKDCKTVTVIAPHVYKEQNRGVISLISLDVSDPAAITEKGRITLTGGHISTRVKDGKLLLMANFRVSMTNGKVDFTNAYSFIPSVDKGNGFELLPIDDIISPETLTSARYTVICKLDEATLEFEDAKALMSYSEEVYVSSDKIFATHGYTKTEESDHEKINRAMTDISVLSYNENEMKYLGGVTLEGYVKDQYSLDEYEGMLRVVTTTDASVETVYKDGAGVTAFEMLGTSANLYCVSLENYEIVATVERFAPWGETVRSVRFDGTAAYVCTAVQLKDPVFFFDLSDVSNITYKETGTIEGFSTSLVNFGNGFLLGIGVGNNWGSFKIEIYEESNDGVVSVAAYELENTFYSENYKSYYINREKQMVGLGVEVYYGGKYDCANRYILVGFDGYRIYEIIDVALPGLNEYKRGVYIDGYMYMLSGDTLVVENIG